MLNIIFVCTGNLCRSPVAEGVLRQRWAAMGRNDLAVSSMGIHGLDHQPASKNAQLVCEENGIDISAHLSRPLVYEELEAAHLVLGLERVHKEFINTFFPRFDDKVFLLGAWPQEATRKSNIADPMGQGMKAYRKAFEIISNHVDRILPTLIEYFG